MSTFSQSSYISFFISFFLFSKLRVSLRKKFSYIVYSTIHTYPNAKTALCDFTIRDEQGTSTSSDLPMHDRIMTDECEIVDHLSNSLRIHKRLHIYPHAIHHMKSVVRQVAIRGLQKKTYDQAWIMDGSTPLCFQNSYKSHAK